MTTGTSRNGKGKEYRYYRCSGRAESGAGACKNRFSIPGEKIEKFIAERIAEIAKGTGRADDGKDTCRIDDGKAAEALPKHLEKFPEVWDVLIPQEKKKLLKLLVKRISFMPETQEVTISLNDPNEKDGGAGNGGSSR